MQWRADMPGNACTMHGNLGELTGVENGVILGPPLVFAQEYFAGRCRALCSGHRTRAQTAQCTGISGHQQCLLRGLFLLACHPERSL